MGLIDKIRRAVEKYEVSALKKKISRIETETTKQGKRVESLTVVLNPRSLSLVRSRKFEFVLSDGTTNKPQNQPSKPKKTSKTTTKPNRVNPTPVEKCPSHSHRCTLVGRSYDYDENCTWVEHYKPGLKIVFVLRTDGVRDIVKVLYDKKIGVPQGLLWWIDNEGEVCKRLNVTATRPSKEPKISSRICYPKIIKTETN